MFINDLKDLKYDTYWYTVTDHWGRIIVKPIYYKLLHIIKAVRFRLKTCLNKLTLWEHILQEMILSCMKLAYKFYPQCRRQHRHT